jgi:hypothetical protein
MTEDRVRAHKEEQISSAVKGDIKLHCLIADKRVTASATIEEVGVYCLSIVIVYGVADEPT